jgi:hypothetical protein
MYHSSQHKCNIYIFRLLLISGLLMEMDVCCVIIYRAGIKYGGNELFASKC